MALRKLLPFAPPLVGFLMAGCSSTPRVKPINAANEPVFHDRNHLSLGIGGGPLWVNDNLSDFGGSPAVRRSIYVTPAVGWSLNVTPWAEYMIPLFGNFLLTGNQYEADGDHLKTGKLHVAVFGGLTSLAYSSLEGWAWTSAGGLRAKFLPTERMYLDATLFSEVLGAFEAASDRIEAGAGYQLTDHVAVAADFFTTRFRASEPNLVLTRSEIELYNDDFMTGARLSLPSYLGRKRKHVITPEAGYEVRNLEFGETWSLRTGLHYRFVFD